MSYKKHTLRYIRSGAVRPRPGRVPEVLFWDKDADFEKLEIKMRNSEAKLQSLRAECERLKTECERGRQTQATFTEMTRALECALCCQVQKHMVVLKCGHLLCKDCEREHRKTLDSCPICRQAWEVVCEKLYAFEVFAAIVKEQN